MLKIGGVYKEGMWRQAVYQVQKHRRGYNLRLHRYPAKAPRQLARAVQVFRHQPNHCPQEDKDLRHIGGADRGAV